MDKYPGSLHKKCTKKLVLQSTKLILEISNCKFSDEAFVQINDTVMETIFPPIYATLSLGHFELRFYRICINEIGETLGQFILENWCWFLDHCKIPLGKTKIVPNRLFEILNSINPSIRFTLEASDKELPFLDIFIKRNDDKNIDGYLF